MNTIVVTGATSGIGFAVCEALLDAGYQVIGVGRSAENCEKAKASLETRRPGTQVCFFAADLMQQREVLRVADEIESIIRGSDSGKLHALVNNAGCVRSRYMTTEEGYEQQFALNYLSGFLLTHRFMPLIRRDNAAVLFTSSGSHKMMRVNWDDLMYQKRYRPLYAYKQSKLCNMLFAFNLRGMGVRACGVDPGLVRTDIGNKNTSGAVNFAWKLRKKHGVPPSLPAMIYTSLCENGFTGLYYGSGAKERRTSAYVNEGNARRLYNISLKLCGINEELWEAPL